MRTTFRSEKYCSIVSAFGFILLFPGFFLYHVAVAAGVIPQFLGGFFGPITFLIVLAYLPVVHRVGHFGAIAQPFAFGAFCFLIIYCVVWMSYNYLQRTGPASGIAELEVITLICAWCALFAVGLFFPLESRVFRVALIVSLVTMFAFAVSLVDPTTLMLNLRQTFNAGETVSTHQGLARSALLVCFPLIAFYLKSKSGLLFVGGAFVVLFLSGARSEFVTFAITSGFFLFSMIRNRATVLAYLILFTLTVITVFANWELLEASRHATIFHLEEVSSWQSRKYLTQVAVEQIKADPVFGIYAGHFEVGEKGFYAHNILSAWVSFGFFGFATYLSLLFYFTTKSVRKGLLGTGALTIWRLALYVNFSSLFLLFTSKSIYWSVPAIGWGIALKAIVTERAASEESICSNQQNP